MPIQLRFVYVAYAYIVDVCLCSVCLCSGRLSMQQTYAYGVNICLCSGQLLVQRTSAYIEDVCLCSGVCSICLCGRRMYIREIFPKQTTVMHVYSKWSLNPTIIPLYPIVSHNIPQKNESVCVYVCARACICVCVRVCVSIPPEVGFWRQGVLKFFKWIFIILRFMDPFLMWSLVVYAC